MLHKRFVFVTLLAPSFSFASTATDTLANATRDAFDNLNENPAFVNAEGGKSHLRIGAAGGVQAITTAGGFGLGIQVNTLSSALVAPQAPDTAVDITTATAIKARGLPLQLSLGSAMGDMKWGAGLQYQNTKAVGLVGTAFDPSFMKVGLNLGVIMGETEASFGFGRDTWKIATEGKTKTAAGDQTAELNDGMSEQTSDTLGVLVRHKMGAHQLFVNVGQSKTNSKLWKKASKTTTSRNDMKKGMGFDLGAERSDKLTEGIMLFSKTWLGWSSSTENASQTRTEVTDLALSSAHGVEVAAASWATLRAGVQASLYGNEKTTATTFSAADQAGTSVANSVSETHMLRGISAPTMGIGFKFGNYTVDASITKDATGAVGFTNNLLGNIEVTAQF